MGRDVDDATEWDRFYSGDGEDAPHWSGEPNPTLVTEVADLRPGRALDVGCGEGADAIWLARGGWHVTAIDPSVVALDRARGAASTAGVDVTWIRTGLADLPDRAGRYDLVTAHYPVLRRTADDAAVTALLGAVAPGGTLLFVHHELDPTHAAEHGTDLGAYVVPDTVVAHLDDRWEVEVLEARERGGRRVSTDPHPRDLVLRAVRALDERSGAPRSRS